MSYYNGTGDPNLLSNPSAPTYYSTTQQPITDECELQGTSQPYYEPPTQQTDEHQLNGISQPYYEPPTQQTEQPNQEFPTPSAFLSPQISQIDGVCDLIVPTPFTYSTHRATLATVIPQQYTSSTFSYDANKTTCCGFNEGLMSLGYLLLPICGAGGAALGIFTNNWAIAALLWVIGAHTFISYCFLFIFCTLLCPSCTRKGSRGDQWYLSSPYFTSIYRRDETDVAKSIKELSENIPTMQFLISASHVSGTRKNRRTRVTYSKWHYVPILSYKFAGQSPAEFLSALDEYRGDFDVTVRYETRYVIDPSQANILQDYVKMFNEVNQKRDKTIKTVPGFFTSYNGVDPNESDPSSTQLLTLVEASSDVPFGQYTLNDDTPAAYIASSLGSKSDVYFSTSHRKVRRTCWTTEHGWRFAMWFGCASCALTAWHKQFRQVVYRAVYHIQLPDVEEFKAAYSQDIDSFVFTSPQQPLSQYI